MSTSVWIIIHEGPVSSIVFLYKSTYQNINLKWSSLLPLFATVLRVSGL